MSTPTVLGRDELLATLTARLRETSGLSVFFSEAVAARVGVNASDLEALEILIRLGPLTAGRLARETGLTTGAITGVVDRLDRHGLARREPDAADRRRVLVAVRPGPALDALWTHYAAMEAATSELFARYSDDELALVARFMGEAVAAARTAIATITDGPVPE